MPLEWKLTAEERVGWRSVLSLVGGPGFPSFCPQNFPVALTCRWQRSTAVDARWASLQPFLDPLSGMQVMGRAVTGIKLCEWCGMRWKSEGLSPSCVRSSWLDTGNGLKRGDSAKVHSADRGEKFPRTKVRWSRRSQKRDSEAAWPEAEILREVRGRADPA